MKNIIEKIQKFVTSLKTLKGRINLYLILGVVMQLLSFIILFRRIIIIYDIISLVLISLLTTVIIIELILFKVKKMLK